MNLSPQQLRQKLVDSYAQSYRRAGINASQRAIEDLVVADCELVDRARALGELDNARADTKDPAPRKDLTETMRDETGCAPVDKVEPWRPRLLHAKPQLVDERWTFALGRLQRILAEGTFVGPSGVSFIGALGPYAQEFATVRACFLMRNVPREKRGFKTNEFDDLSDADALRIYRRRVEDICDRSTGVLGSWYVK